MSRLNFSQNAGFAKDGGGNWHQLFAKYRQTASQLAFSWTAMTANLLFMDLSGRRFLFVSDIGDILPKYLFITVTCLLSLTFLCTLIMNKITCHRMSVLSMDDNEENASWEVWLLASFFVTWLAIGILLVGWQNGLIWLK